MQIDFPVSKKKNVMSNVRVDSAGNVYVLSLNTGQQLPMFPKENVAEYAKKFFPPNAAYDGASVRMSNTEKYIYGISPIGGKHIVTFSSFVPERGTNIPKPKFKQGGKTYPSSNGGTFTTKDKMTFMATLEIMAGPFKGCNITAFFDYLFALKNDGKLGLGDPMGSSSKKNMQLLVDFMEVQLGSLQDQNFEYEQNFLPTLEGLLLHTGKAFQVGVEKGYVKTFEELPAGLSLASFQEAESSAPAAVPPAPKFEDIPVTPTPGIQPNDPSTPQFTNPPAAATPQQPNQFNPAAPSPNVDWSSAQQVAEGQPDWNLPANTQQQLNG